MNRWWGSQADSESQKSARAERSARRYVRNLPTLAAVTSDEEVFEDADASFSQNLNLDGNPDESDPLPSTSARASSATMPDPPPPAKFDETDAADDAEAWKKELKLKFDQSDVKYWFNAVESQMKKFGINRQWSKKDAIVPLLPDEVVEELKPILRLSEDEAGALIYKDLKTEILSLYGPREEDAFKKAMALRLGSGRPSALGKKLIHVLCPGSTPFEGCHCARIVFGFWEAQMTPEIRTKLAGRKFTKETYKEIFKIADETHIANGQSVPAVVAATKSVARSSGSSSTSDAQSSSSEVAGQVAATGRGGGRGSNRGGRGNFRGGRGGGNRGSYNGNNSNNNQNRNQQQQQNQNQAQTGQKPHQRGPKASPDVPADACARHWKEGRQATYCSDPLVCSWSHIIVPRK